MSEVHHVYLIPGMFGFESPRRRGLFSPRPSSVDRAFRRARGSDCDRGGPDSPHFIATTPSQDFGWGRRALRSAMRLGPST